MQTSAESRKRRFRMALAATGETQAEFAAAHGVTSGHLSHVLNGRESNVLTAAIDAYIAEHLSERVA